MNRELEAVLTPHVSGKHGAPMGRPNVSGYWHEGEFQEVSVLPGAQPFNLVRVALDAQGYDRGGAYWGGGCGDKLFGYVGPISDVRGFVWARDREDAKRQVRGIHPNARFYR